MELEKYLNQIKPISQIHMKKAKENWDMLAKPLGSLGKLESTVIKIAGIQQSENVKIDKPAVCVMCADNGVVRQNVTQTGSEVTAIVAENMTSGQSSVCIMANAIGGDVIPVDIGICSDVTKLILNRKIMYGTNDIATENAMTRKQAVDAIIVGIEMAIKLKNSGYNIIITGEMGIGNTTTSSAIAAVVLDKSVEEVTGRGAGLTSAGVLHKIEIIKQSIERSKPNKNNPIDVLHKVGGLDIAGIVGLYIGGAIAQIPVVIDGFISSVAALLACEIAPKCKEYMLPSHVSAEPAGKMLLEKLGFSQMITCDMCLGEGTGGVVAVALMQMGEKVYSQMSSFEVAKVSKYVELI